MKQFILDTIGFPKLIQLQIVKWSLMMFCKILIWVCLMLKCFLPQILVRIMLQRRQTRGVVSSMTCFGHNLHLAVLDSFEASHDISDTLKSGSEIVGFYNRSPKAYANSFENQMKMTPDRDPLRLIQPVDTRWNSKLFKEKRLLKLKSPLGEINVGNSAYSK